MSTQSSSLQTALEHHRSGRLLEAEHFYRKVLAENPRHAQAHHLLGLVAFQAGKPEMAVNFLEQAIALDGFHAPYLVDLAEVQQSMQQLPQAVISYRKALKVNNEMAEVWCKLGALHRAQLEIEDAVTCFREAIRLDPNLALAQRGLGETLQRANAVPEAQACFAEAVRLAPQQALNYFYLGTSFHELGQHLEAIACYQKALQLAPDLEGPTALRAEARLALGDFATGWPDYTAWQRRQYVGSIATLPLWSSGDPKGHKTWIRGQVGYGEVLQFIRYLPLLEQHGAEVVTDVPEQLLSLLQQAGYTNLVPPDVQPAGCEAQAHLLSLPMLLGTTLETIPKQVPYLQAAPDKIARWRKQLAALPGLKVGIHWQGNPAYALDRLRSIPLADFAPLAAVRGVTLVSLQKNEGLEQLAELEKPFAVTNLGPELDNSGGAFLDTAAVIMNLDLVVTCDSAIGHLAGALGRPVWLALSTGSDWRWLTARDDSPWYPTMRLFRQQSVNDWEPVMAQIARELATLVQTS